jgi:hypothetical protein
MKGDVVEMGSERRQFEIEGANLDVPLQQGTPYLEAWTPDSRIDRSLRESRMENCRSLSAAK